LHNKGLSQHATPMEDAKPRLPPHGNSRRTLISGIRTTRFQTSVLTEISSPPKVTWKMLNLDLVNGLSHLLLRYLKVHRLNMPG
jgi:hypothetical protein